MMVLADTSAVTCTGVRPAHFRRDVGPAEGAAGSPGVCHRVLDGELPRRRRQQPASVAGRRQQRPEAGLVHSRGPGHWCSQHTGEDRQAQFLCFFMQHFHAI